MDKDTKDYTGAKGGTVAAKASCHPAELGVGKTAPSLPTEDKITSQSVAVSKKN